MIGALRRLRRGLLGGLARAGATAQERAYAALERLYDPFVASGDPEADRPPKTLGAFFRWSFRGMEAALLALVATSLVIGFVEAISLSLVGQLVDIAGASDPATAFAENQGLFWLLLFLAVVARPVAMVAQGALGGMVVGPGLAPRVIWGLHRHALGRSLRFFEDDFAGRLAQREMQTAGAIVTVTTDVANAFGLIVAYVIAMAIALGAANPWLAAITLGWAGAYVLILAWILPGVRRAARLRAERRSAVSGQLVDSFTNIKTVKLFAHAGREQAAARRSLEAFRAAGFDFGRRVLALRVWLAILNAALMGGLLALSLWLWSAGAASIGVAAAALALAFRAAGMSNWIAFTALSVFSEIGVAEDGVAALTGDAEVVDAPDADPELDPIPLAAPPAASTQAAAAPALAARRAAPPAIRFQGVRFSYRGARPGAAMVGVDGVDLDIAPGEKVGLVGPSGAGKTTLVSLLLRLYEPQEGRIEVGGRDVAGLTQEALRRNIGVITQESAMFNRSTLENIRYGRPEATEGEAIEAARRARAHEFIKDIEDGAGRRGYRAYLGERGVKLSGGQRQRVALARVLLKDAPILVLDEATSALDSEVEAAILAAVDAASEKKTVLAIAHRLSTIARMDRIVAMERGRIVEQGTHESLLARRGLYARLWARQSGGFIASAAAAE